MDTQKDPASIDTTLQAALKEFPCVTALAVVGQNVVYQGAAGEIGPGMRASVDTTMFMTASISKTFLAVLCMQCTERSELDLDEDICAYLPCSVRNPIFPSEPITAKHLLTHTSSLRDDESALSPGPYRTQNTDCSMTLEQYVCQRLCPTGAVFDSKVWGKQRAPGKASYHYSNAGFTLLAWVVERATKQSLQSLAQNRIFNPLEMHHTKYTLAEAQEVPGSSLAVPSSCGKLLGHYGVAEWPAAGLRSTAADLGRYLVALMGTKCAILSEESIQEMLPATFRCGLAWWGKDTWYGDPRGGVWTHGGFMEGVRTHLYFWPHEKAGIVILTNGEGSYLDIEKALKAVLPFESSPQTAPSES